MVVLLDTALLSEATHPTARVSKPILEWLAWLVTSDVTVLVPEIADYEQRREMLRANQSKSVARLDRFALTLGYLPLNTAAMRKAAQFWADLRNIHRPGATDNSLDGDVILAGQAFVEAARVQDQVVIATKNLKHFSHLPVEADSWQNIQPITNTELGLPK